MHQRQIRYTPPRSQQPRVPRVVSRKGRTDQSIQLEYTPTSVCCIHRTNHHHYRHTERVEHQRARPMQIMALVLHFRRHQRLRNPIQQRARASPSILSDEARICPRTASHTDSPLASAASTSSELKYPGWNSPPMQSLSSSSGPFHFPNWVKWVSSFPRKGEPT